MPIKTYVRNSIILLIAIFTGYTSYACTNYIVTKGASTDGSVMLTYSADSHVLYGELYHYPSQKWPAGSMLKVKEWDTGKPLGEISQAPYTYSVIGNMNEYQLAIGETTFGGREELQTQEGAIIDYGSLIYIALQRSKNAREAIKTMTTLVTQYGYASEGESFSIVDAKEAWILEMIGKGKGQKGAVWVAVRIPDGCVSGHANQARITQFPKNDPENCVYSQDVISFARSKGWFNGTDEQFSFSDTYNPLDFGGARACDARVWSMFNKVNSSMGQYQDYAMGKIKFGQWGYGTNRMPLYIKPDKKISIQDLMELTRDHYEGTAMDMTHDVGAGPFGSPIRFRPMTWKVDSVEYCNERAISTQQTGFCFVAQCRDWLPDPVGGILWFGLDDTYCTVYTPMYCGMTQIPAQFAVGNGDMLTYSTTSAFWLFNRVANTVYNRWSVMIGDLQKAQHELENTFIAQVNETDKAATELYKKNEKKARKIITNYSLNAATKTFNRWQTLDQYLLVKYIDGNIKKEKDGKFETNGYGMPVSPSQPGYPEWWLKKVAADHGNVIKTIPEKK